MPTYDQIEQFLSKRVSTYEAGLVSNETSEKKSNHRKSHSTDSKALFVRTTNTNKCLVCANSHKVYMCEKFKNMSISERRNLVTTSGICFNCLNFGHQVKFCRYIPCPRCGKKNKSKLRFQSLPPPPDDFSFHQRTIQRRAN